MAADHLALDLDDRGAVFSDDGLHRYRLWRTWSDAPPLVFTMLNPSTADATEDDPTIRRCIGFAKRDGFGGIEVVNLYGLRATKPEHLLDYPDPEGPDNVEHVLAATRGRHATVLAWGAHASNSLLPRSEARECLYLQRYGGHGPWCLGLTKDGEPRHPLFVPADQPLVRWSW